MTYLAGVMLALTWPGTPAAVETASAWVEGIAEAAQALDEGDGARSEAAARAALKAQSTGRAGARARLAVGLALRAEARFGEAAEMLAEADSKTNEDGLLRPYLSSARADALARAGKPEAAASIFSEIASQGAGSISDRARWREAEVLLAAKRHGAAVQAYQKLLGASTGTSNEPVARLGLGTAYRLHGDEQRALEQYRKIWLDYPGTPEGKSAERLLVQWKGVGGASPSASSAELLSRAEKLLGQARARLALQTLDQLDAAMPSKAPLARSRLLRALVLLQLNRAEEADALARPLASELPVEERPAAEWILARATARLKRIEEASGHYQQVAEARYPPQVPGLTSQQLRDLPDDAAYLSAWLFYDAGRYLEAVSRLEQFTRQRPNSRRAEDAKWFRAWSLYRAGRHEAAAKAFVALERGPLREAALYWHARLAPSRSRAAALYRTTYQLSRGGWYGLLAAARLSAMGRTPPPLPSLRTRPLDETPSAPQLSRAAMLFGLGLRGEALEELSSLARRPGPTAALLAQLAYQAGDAELPFRMARDHLAPTTRVQRWSHPLPYPKLVSERCAAFGIDPLLFLAVMRRESSFQRQIRSNAGAEGLLQLIPPTAERLASLLGLSPELAGQLDEPEVSISLGAYYLGLLTSRFQEPALILAAYNAGPAAAAGWAHDRAKLPLDEWVETIPYRETRHYVRIVLADHALYRRLNGLPPTHFDPAKPVKVPPPGISF